METRNIRALFVLPKTCTNERETSEEMQQAFEACKQNCIKTIWIPENEFKLLELNKTDIVVFQTFKGKCFDQVRGSKSVRIVGSWCLLTCLTQGIQIPNFPWPIFSIAMNNCTVTISSLPKAERLEVQEKIQFMGGFYSPNLVTNCTHLVTNSVKSEKYIKAAETGVKILLPSWVNDVWQTSLKSNVHCNDDQFIEKHKCPPFHNLVICCTGLNQLQRTELARLVERNGGTYREQLHVATTDILICNSGTASNKYLAAKKKNIKCVNLEWVKDSIKNGYAMPDTDYAVQISTSTPTKDAHGIPPNFSMISVIGNASQLPNTNDTIDATLNITTVSSLQSSRKRKSDSNEHNELVDSISMQNVKLAGPFLDGCGVYLAGFGTEQREKLCKILNFGGATRYDDISERVTHIIVGDTSCHDLKLLAHKNTFTNFPVVNVHWLLDSLVAEHPVSEEKYIVSSKNLSRPDSPLSKKGLHVLQEKNASQERPAITNSVDLQMVEEVDVAKQYLCNNGSVQDDTLARLLRDASDFHSKQNTVCAEQSKSAESVTKQTSLHDKDESLSSAVDESSQPAEPIFEGLKFVIAGFAEDTFEQVKLAIEAMQGKVVSRQYRGASDYAVVPVFSTELPKQSVTEVVTDLWISECWQENEIRPVEYFHKPISIQEGACPLKGCVITISSYVNYERNFLRNVIKELGGICQEQLSKITCPKSGVIACTHLVTPEPTGKKYTAAIKWGLPVVNKDWLLECARTSQLEPETLYLVGDSKCSKSTAASSTLQLETPSKNCIDISKANSLSKIIKMSKNVNATSNMGSPIHLNRILNTTTMEAVPVNKNLSNALETVRKTPHRNTENTNASMTESPVRNILSQARKKKLLETPDKTPVGVDRVLQSVQNTSDISSQITPVRSILAGAKKLNLLGTPESLPYPKAWDHVDTPETPLGAFIRENPSPNLRKEMLRYLNTLPDMKPRRNSTPLSELKRKLWDKICPPKDSMEQLDFDSQSEEIEELVEKVSTPSKSVPENIVNGHLQQLHDMLTSSGGASRDSFKGSRRSIIPVVASEVKDSQPNTIGWDDCLDCDIVQPQKPVPVFIFTGLEQEMRQSMTTQLESLGARVVDVANFDPNCTHVICRKPSRNEKILASMAAGKWILHPSYVEQCSEEGKLVDEEPFEFGNPKSNANLKFQADKENEGRFAAIHYWRKEIARRGYGPFHDMKAIIVSQRKEPLIRILEAGGAVVVEANPPFTEPIHATHCILDLKSVSDISVYIPLAKRGVYCVNTIFINDFLQRTIFDARDAIIPDLIKFYENLSEL